MDSSWAHGSGRSVSGSRLACALQLGRSGSKHSKAGRGKTCPNVVLASDLKTSRAGAMRRLDTRWLLRALPVVRPLTRGRQFGGKQGKRSGVWAGLVRCASVTAQPWRNGGHPVEPATRSTPSSRMLLPAQRASSARWPVDPRVDPCLSPAEILVLLDAETANYPGACQEPTPGLEPGTPSLRVKCSTS
jgi:hypothetical protein